MYNWTRFWSPTGQSIATESGYLLDPLSQAGQYLNKYLVSSANLPDDPVLILLGEAGTGKSSEVKRLARPGDYLVDLGEFGSDATLASAIEAGVQEVSGNASLRLFLDGLDEAMIGVPQAAATIVRCMRQAASAKARLCISCRTGAWPSSLSTGLKNLFGEKKVKDFELVMLREADVRLAAESNSLDATAFLAAIAERSAEALASNPTTLALLAALYSDRKLPTSRADLYEQGLLKLCEQPEERRDRGNIPEDRGSPLAPAQLLSVATRLAAATSLSARPRISLAPLGQEVPNSIRLSDASGESEGTGPAKVDVTEEAARIAVAHTGLFTAHGPQALGFAHKTYAEYLTARFLHQGGFSSPQVHALLFVPDEHQPRVVPQLHEIAAWFADLDASFGERLLHSEPGLLLRSDLRLRPNYFKERLVAALLRAIKDERLTDLDDAVRSDRREFGDYFQTARLLPQLNHPGLGAQLRVVISDSSQPERVRASAIRIGEACHLADIAASCADLALDQFAPRTLRISAANAVRRLDDETTCARLVPLARGEGGDDPDDELRGCALIAVWPKHLSGTDLLPCLTVPKHRRFHGSYQHFLQNTDAASDFPPDALPAALRWATPHIDSGRYDNDLGVLASGIAYQGWHAVDRPEVLVELARLLNRRFAAHAIPLRVPEDAPEAQGAKSPEHAVSNLLRADSDTRRTVLAACLSAMTDSDKAFNLTWGSPGLAQPEDFEWALECACTSPHPLAKRFATLAFGLASYRDTGPLRNVRHLELWLDARERSVAVREVMHWAIQTALGSPEAKRAKLEWLQECAFERRRTRNRAKRRPRVARSQHIDDLIARCETDARWFARLADDLAFDDDWEFRWHFRIQERPGWILSPQPAKEQIIACAQRYLLECPTSRGEVKPDEPIINPLTAAAATFLLWEHARDMLRAIPIDRWQRIAPALTKGLAGSGGQNEKLRKRLMRLLLRRARARTCSEAVRLTVAGSEQSFLPEALRLLDDAAPLQLRVHLLELAKTSLRATKVFAELLPWLVRRHTPGAKEFAESLLADVPQTEAAKTAALAAATALLYVQDDTGWPLILKSIQSDSAWGDELIKAIAPGRGDRRPASKLPDRVGVASIGVLAELLMERFDPASDPVHDGVYSPTGNDNAREWRDALISYLIAAGTDEAVAALRRMRDRWRDREWLGPAVREAEKQRRRAAWQGVSPQAILALRNDAQRRVVRSGDELLNVLAESLRRWERRMRELDLIRLLWNEVSKGVWRPKDEETCRDAMFDHLRSDLQDRRIVLGREIQLSRRTSRFGAAGTRVDIGVEAIGVGGDRIRAFIEVKGSWNPEVKTGLSEQLANRYLIEHRAAHGLYVVSWCDDTAWDRKDRRRKSGPWASREEADRELREMALQVSKARGVTIVACMLNCGLGKGDPARAAPCGRPPNHP
ncbi:MAG: hypothetical protein IT436_13965 [Phycisphaerales bacterium]|nr:hypothetical protein [Phycisphaerales bacterium]